MAGEWAAIVVNRDGAVFLDGCLRALTGCDLPPVEIVVVDNASTDDSLADLAGWPSVVVEASGVDLGYAGAVNRGLERCEAPLLLALRPEAEVERAFGAALVHTFAAQPRLGLAAPLLLTPEGDLLAAGGELERPLLQTRWRGQRESDASAFAEPVEVGFAPDLVLALRRAALVEVSGLDTAFWPGAYADVDLAIRMRDAGWLVRYEPALRAVVLAVEPTLEEARNRLRLALKHLTPTEWAEVFVPAELERLRGLLGEAATPAWPAGSGAEAIEALARAGRLARGPGLIPGAPLAELQAALSALMALPPLEGTGRRGLRRDPALDRFIEQQRAFNEAVVRALEAQARLGRELTAELLLVLLDLLGHGQRPGMPG